MWFSSCGPLIVLLCVFGCWTVRGNSDEIEYFERNGKSMESVCQVTQLLQGVVEKCGAAIEQATKDLEANGNDGFKAAVADLKRRAEVLKGPATVLVNRIWRYIDKSKSPDFGRDLHGPDVLKAAQDCEKKASEDPKSESIERLISENKDSSTLNDPIVYQQLPEVVRLFKDFEGASRKADEERQKAEEEGKKAEEEKEKAEEASRKGKVEEGGALVATASTEGKTEGSTTAEKEKPNSTTYSEHPAVTSFVSLVAALLSVVL